MTSGVYLSCCSKEFKISSENNEPPSRFSKCLNKNFDLVVYLIAAIFATFSALVAYGYVTPIFSWQHPMFVAGSLASGSAAFFAMGIVTSIFRRGCIIVKNNPQPPLGVP